MDPPADRGVRAARRGRRLCRRRGRRALRRRRVRAHDDGARAGGAHSGAARGADPRRVGAGGRTGSEPFLFGQPVPRDRARRPLAGRIGWRSAVAVAGGSRHGRRRSSRSAAARTACARFVFFVAASVALAIVFLSMAAAIAAATDRRVHGARRRHIRLVLLRPAVRRRGAVARWLAHRPLRRAASCSDRCSATLPT